MPDTQALMEQRFGEAIAHHQAGDLEAAIAAYQEVIHLEPAHKVAYNNLGTALKALGRHQEAIKAYWQAVSLDQTYAAAIYNLGTAYQVTGELKQAFRLYSAANDLRPDDVYTLYNMAVLAENDQLFDYAAALYQQITQLVPGHQKALASRALCLGQLGRFEEAMALASELIERYPDDARYWCLAGEICLDSELWEEACRYLRRSLELAPAAMDARMELAVAQLKQARFADALATCDDVVRMAPAYLPAHVLRGHALTGLGRTGEAAAALERGRKVSGVAATWLEQALRTASMPSDKKAIDRSRRRYFASLDNAVTYGGTFKSALECLARTPFFFAYHGRNDRDIMERLAQVLPQLCPELTFVAPHCR